jgi:hypothetical protein
MKKLLKILKVFFIAVAALFLILLVTPFLFKGKLMEIAKKELNGMLTAQVDFSDLKLSFIRSFPDARIVLEDLQVTGTGVFEGDTLVSFKKFSVTVDIKSVIGMENIEIKSVLLDQARLYAHVAADGQVNWDVMKAGDAAEEAPAPEDTSASAAINISLDKFEIRNACITYRDDSSRMVAVIDDLNFLLKGDMSSDHTSLFLQLDIAALDFLMNGAGILRKARIGFVSEIDADLNGMKFTFSDNRFNINEIVLMFNGSVAMQGNDVVTDVTFATGQTSFKSLLSLIPAIYMKDFADIRTAGELMLSGHVKGTYNERQLPSAGLDLTVNKAMFQYPDLPKSADNIEIAVKLFYDGEVFDRTTVDVDKFHLALGGNPFDLSLHVKTPESDMQIAGAFKGKMDFNSFADVVPLDNATLNGMLACDLSFSGKMSSIEKEQYEDFQAEGTLQLNGFNFTSPDFPQGIKISTAHLGFTPKMVELINFNAVVGRSDMALKGSLENFIPYIFNNATIRGSLSLASNTIDLNEFMSDEPEQTVADTIAPSPLSIIEVPKNIDFRVNADIGNIYFDKLAISSVSGFLFVKDGKVRMEKLGMNLLDGSMLLSGEYNTQDVSKPFVDFQMDVRQFDISSSLASFSMLETMFDSPQDYAGKVSADLTLNALLDAQMNPVLNSVLSKGQLKTHGVEIRNSKVFGTMADVLKNEKWRTVSPSDMDIRFEIKDGRLLMVEPLQFTVNQAKVVLTGDQGLDMTLNYNLKASVPAAAVGAADLLKSIPGGASIKELSLAGIIRGTVTKPEVQISAADMVNDLTKAVKEQVTEVVTQKVEDVKEEVKAEVTAQVDKLLADAEAQAQKLRESGRQLAAKTRESANAAAEKLEKEAASKSALEKRVAKAAADKLRQEGETNAKKVEQESEKQAETLLNTARQKAEEIKNKQ